jgi:hypothetical protein
MRARRARGARDAIVASTQTFDSASSGLGTPPVPARVPSADSSSDREDVGEDSADRADSAADAKETPRITAPAPLAAPAPPVVSAPTGTPTRQRRAEKSAPRTSIGPPVIATTPPPAPPMAPVVPPPPAQPSTAASRAPANAEQARTAVDAAGRLVDEKQPLQAMAVLRGAMPLLPSRDDSVTALFHLARAMIMRSGNGGDAASHQRGCSILTLISRATSHPKAGEIRSLSLQECK